MIPSRLSPILFVAFALHGFIATATAVPLVINEFLASNANGLRDGDGDRQDWIEIHNPNPGAVPLGGYGLSDDIADLGKWTFPEGTMIAGGEYLTIFASGDGVPDSEGHQHTR